MAEVEQPNVPNFMQAWLRSQASGTTLEDHLIRTAEDVAASDEPPFVLLEDGGWIRDRGVPAYLPYRLSLTTYGRTKAEAAALFRSVTNLIHDAKNVLVDGIGFWGAFDETGPQVRSDPGSWPAVFGIVAIYMPDRAIPVEGS